MSTSYSTIDLGISDLSKKSELDNYVSCPERSKSNRYILYATREYRINYGRIYISLPIEYDVSNLKIKEKYNLM